MKRIALLLFTLCTLNVFAQRPFEDYYHSSEFGIEVQLNLYEKSIPVPGAEDELCYGFFSGGLNGVWAIMKVISLEGDKATVRMVNDLGFEAQTVELTYLPVDSPEAAEFRRGGMLVKLVKDNNMKQSKDRKYVKLPKSFKLYALIPLP